MTDPEVKVLMLKGNKGDGLSDDDMNTVKALISSSVADAEDSISNSVNSQIADTKDSLNSQITDAKNSLNNSLNSRIADTKDSINNSLNSRIAGARFVPAIFANSGDLKKAYPNGKDGIFVTADTGHMWLFINGAWKDAGVYQAAGQSTSSFAFFPSTDGLPNYDTLTRTLDFRCVKDRAQITFPDGTPARIPKNTVVDVNFGSLGDGTPLTTALIVFDTETGSVMAQSPYVKRNAKQIVLASVRKYPKEGNTLVWSGVLAQNLLIDERNPSRDNIKFTPSKDGLPYYDSKRRIINFNCLTDRAYIDYNEMQYQLPKNATVSVDFSDWTSIDILMDLKTRELTSGAGYHNGARTDSSKLVIGKIRKLSNGRVDVEGFKLLDEVSPKNCTGIIPIAHRGLNSLAPEESLEAYSLAVRSGYNDIECDVHFTKDNIAILHHDNSINRIARNQDGTQISETVNIAEKTLTELDAYDYGIYKSEIFKYNILLPFTDFVKFGRKTGAKLHVELKNHYTDEQCQILLDTVGTYRMASNIGWQAFDFSSLDYIANHDENAQLELLAGSLTDDLMSQGQQWLNGKRKVVLSVGSADFGAVAKAHGLGFDVYIWTIDDQESAEKYIDMGVDGIMTNGYVDLPNLLSNEY